MTYLEYLCACLTLRHVVSEWVLYGAVEDRLGRVSHLRLHIRDCLHSVSPTERFHFCEHTSLILYTVHSVELIQALSLSGEICHMVPVRHYIVEHSDSGVVLQTLQSFTQDQIKFKCVMTGNGLLYKHTCDAIYTHFWGITYDIYCFGRPFLHLHLFTHSPPIHGSMLHCRTQWLRGRASDIWLQGSGSNPVLQMKPWASFFMLHCSSSLSCMILVRAVIAH